MKKIQKFFYVLACCFLFFFSNCKKEESISEVLPQNLPEVAKMALGSNLYNEELLKKDGYIGFMNFAPIGNSTFVPNIYATFKDKVNNTVVTHGALKINNYTLMPDNDLKAYDNTFDRQNMDYLRSITGQSVNFTLLNKTGNGNEMATTLYVPKPLSLTNLTQNTNTKLSRQANFSWNMDDQNQYGLFMAIVFDPKYKGNEAFAHLSPSYRFVQTEDDGTFSFSGAELAGIPANAVVDITIARGNFHEVQGLSGKYVVYSYSRLGGKYVVE